MSANLIPTSRLHLEAELTESNTVGYQVGDLSTETTLADQYPQYLLSNRPAIDDKENTGYYFKVLDTIIVYKHLKLKFHQVQPRASESDLPLGSTNVLCSIGYLSEAMVSIGIGCHTVNNLKLYFV